MNIGELHSFKEIIITGDKLKIDPNSQIGKYFSLL